jgi:hypothetical protein
MGEILFWIVAVFLVLAGPPLLAAWSEWRRERGEAGSRPPEIAVRRPSPRGAGAPEASRPGGLWPGVVFVALTL